MSGQFVHLHVHTKYSLLDGASEISDLVGYAKELGMPALAITDHGVMYGAIEFYQECKKQGIKPIIGCEVYMAKSDLHVQDKERYHLILLAENMTGYHNLMKLVSIGCVEGFYYKPRIDKNVLRQYSEGLICLSACLQGEIPWHIRRGELETAENCLKEYLSIFGKEHFFLEVQNHDLPEDITVTKELLSLAEKYQLDLVATNDLHYVRKEDAEGQDILLCIQTNARYTDEDRMRMNNDMYYLKSREEMEERFPNIPQALDNTLKIAERCNVELEFGHLLLPEFPLPEGITEAQYLRQLCEEGFPKRYAADDEKARERMEYELGVIHQMGYDGYFLIVWDFINYCRSHDIPVGPGRGSAAGSIVAYLTTITNIDPLKYNLLFERFLNPERVSMPDIDTDICYVKRHLVVDYLARKYGESHVAQIITFGTLAAKAAVKDVGRSLEIPLDEVNKVTKLIGTRLGITLKAALEESRDLKAWAEGDEKIGHLLHLAGMVEGKPRHTSTHAAGVVITPGELTNYVPLQLTSSQEDDKDYICTQYDMNKAGDLGLLKMDLLGLRTLTVIDDTLKMLKANRGLELDIDKIDLKDKKTCEMLCRGETECVFQMESEGMTKMMRDLQPESFEDLIPLVALYRPGPLGSGMGSDFINGRHGKRTARVLHPLMEPILADTYGVILYQEQVMQITSALAGFSLGEADILRRAMGKKKAKELDSMKEKFIEGAARLHNIKRELSEEIFALLQHFAGYGFNKSHSAAYAYVAFQTAYLKAHYPVEFLAAFLDSVIENSTKLNWYINVARNMGIKILPPDINVSGGQFSVDGNAIRFGLKAIKNAGDAAVSAIIEERRKHGPYKNLVDFTQRVDMGKVNKRVIENLIQCGAMNSFGVKRSQLLAIMDKAVELAGSRQKDAASGQLGLFGEEEFEELNDIELPPMEEMDLKEILRLEKELLGFYVTGNPLDTFADKLMALPRINAIVEDSYRSDSRITVAGVISSCRIRTTKNGDTMANIVLDDNTGTMQVVIFPRTYMTYSSYIAEEQIVYVRGRVNFDEDVPRLFAEEIKPLSSFVLPERQRKAAPNEVHIYLQEGQNTKENQQSLAAIFMRYRGKTPIFLHLGGSDIVIKAAPQFWVKGGNKEFEQEVRNLLGPKALKS